MCGGGPGPPLRVAQELVREMGRSALRVRLIARHGVWLWGDRSLAPLYSGFKMAKLLVRERRGLAALMGQGPGHGDALPARTLPCCVQGWSRQDNGHGLLCWRQAQGLGLSPELKWIPWFTGRR